jgi:superfamily II DNA or RNA helicase
MREQLFTKIDASIEGNEKLRDPQIEAYRCVKAYYENPSNKDREVGIVLPVGCGKSGLITIVPFALKSKRALVVAPGTNISDQLMKDFNPAKDDMFYKKAAIILSAPYPEAAELRGNTTSKSDLVEADVVVTNIQQLQGVANRWLDGLDDDFFDLIMFDEGHHNVAESWQVLRRKFPKARILNVSATPARADGKMMHGEIIYIYPVAKAVKKGYVKHLKAIQLNPSTLQYVESKNGKAVTIGLAEVKELAKTDAIFRRSVVSSKRSLDTIVDASIREMNRLRKESGENKIKIIASALNYEHCKQIVAAYRERELRADYVHSNDDGAANKKVLAQLENHELDVIVQVRKLGEGFDHKYLSVAAVFSIFANLSPFVQFVGRIMRVIVQDSPGDILNRGTVVYHAGANTATAWSDFREFAEDDQEWFKLFTEERIVGDEPEVEIDPTEEMTKSQQAGRTVSVVEQSEVSMEMLPLLKGDDVRTALELLRGKGLTSGSDFETALNQLEPIHVGKQARRRATRKELDELVKNQAGKSLAKLGKSPGGKDLDSRHSKTNFVLIKSLIDKRLNALVDHGDGIRHDLSQPELDKMKAALSEVAQETERELGDAR